MSNTAKKMTSYQKLKQRNKELMEENRVLCTGDSIEKFIQIRNLYAVEKLLENMFLNGEPGNVFDHVKKLDAIPKGEESNEAWIHKKNALHYINRIIVESPINVNDAVHLLKLSNNHKRDVDIIIKLSCCGFGPKRMRDFIIALNS